MARTELRDRWNSLASNADWQVMADLAREAASASLDIPTGDHWS